MTLRRTPLRRSTKPIKRSPLARSTKPIPKVSDKQRAKNRELAKAKKAVRQRSGGRCEYRDMDGDRCPRRAEHAHHIVRRSQTEGHDPALMAHVCWYHHQLVHANPADAYEAGMLVHGWEVA